MSHLVDAFRQKSEMAAKHAPHISRCRLSLKDVGSVATWRFDMFFFIRRKQSDSPAAEASWQRQPVASTVALRKKLHVDYLAQQWCPSTPPATNSSARRFDLVMQPKCLGSCSNQGAQLPSQFARGWLARSALLLSGVVYYYTGWRRWRWLLNAAVA